MRSPCIGRSSEVLPCRARRGSSGSRGCVSTLHPSDAPCTQPQDAEGRRSVGMKKQHCSVRALQQAVPCILCEPLLHSGQDEVILTEQLDMSLVARMYKPSYVAYDAAVGSCCACPQRTTLTLHSWCCTRETRRWKRTDRISPSGSGCMSVTSVGSGTVCSSPLRL